uniref:RING-type domain-containing protein n=1 Tax=Strongyloides papillosus TaxID=174720 RepID=A0A0N5BCC3_STREA
MSFRCSICSEAYTSNGTGHSLCSTKCGHLFGKSCLSRWACIKSKRGRFECPTCRANLRITECHRIYDVPNEIFEITSDGNEGKCRSEDDVLRRCAFGTLKNKHFFIKQDIEKNEDLLPCTIKYCDASNGHILIAGYFKSDEDSSNTIFFLKIYERDHLCYSRNFGPTNITAVALNKSCEDSLEFCIGLENGIIQSTVISISNNVYGTPIETVIFNENKKIDSMCFLGYNNIVYSVGDSRVSNIFNIHIDRVDSKRNWFQNVEVKLDTVTNLKAVDDHTLFGRMDDKIYVFEKNKTPYVLCSEDNMSFINYEYDQATNIMSISALHSADGNNVYETARLILRGIKKKYTRDTKGWRSKKYSTHSIGDSQGMIFDFESMFFGSTSIVTQKNVKNSTYTFTLDLKNRILQPYAVNNGFIKLSNGKKIGSLSCCIGIIALDKPNFFTSKMTRIPIVVIFGNGFRIYNFYSSIEGAETR